MELTIVARNLTISDTIRAYIEKRIGRLDRYLPTISEGRVELSTQNTRSAGELHTAQLTVRVGGTILRAEERSPDLFASIDSVLDKMCKQIARFKGKRHHSRTRPRAEAVLIPEEYEEEELEEGRIVRRKRFPMHPMSEEEAIEQMELLGHDFFVFYNAETAEVNVLYRRKDGDYGLIEPEIA